MYKNILIFGHSNIGDVIYDLTVVNPLRGAFPEARISFMTSARCSGIVNGYEGVHEVIVLDKQGNNKGIMNRLRFTAQIRKRRFDLIIVLRSSLNYLFMGGKTVWRITNRLRSQFKHPVDRYIHTLQAKGIKVDQATFNFKGNRREEKFCDEFLSKNGIMPNERLICILPFAAWSLKSWPVTHWNQLIKVLKEQYGIKAVNIGKFSSNEQGQRLAKLLSSDIIAADDTTLQQALALLKRGVLFVGPDSSLLHLASCMGVETIGLYGATSSDHFYPYFHRHNIIWPKKKLPCAPCYPGPKPGWFCCSGTAKPDFGPCMEEIAVEDVLLVIKERLNLE